MTLVEIAVHTSTEQRRASITLPAVEQPSPEPSPTHLPGLNEIEQQSWQHFTDAATHLYGALNRQLMDAHNLTLLDVMLLRLLANSRKGSARMGDLAQALAVIPSRVSQQARRLESRGLVARNKSPADRRVVIASITREGRARLKLALKTYAKGVRNFYLNPLSRQQMAALGDGCRRVDAALREPRRSEKKPKRS